MYAEHMHGMQAGSFEEHTQLSVPMQALGIAGQMHEAYDHSTLTEAVHAAEA